MIPPALRVLASIPALFAIGACAVSKPEVVRPVSDSATPIATASPADLPVPPPPDLILSQYPCHSDADCIPASCCHPVACMSLEKAKPCKMMCTQVCMPGTLDCGGACLCHQGHCAARPGNGGK